MPPTVSSRALRTFRKSYEMEVRIMNVKTTFAILGVVLVLTLSAPMAATG